MTDMAADTDSTGTSIDRATRSAVRWRVPVSVVGIEASGIRWTLARAMREASGGEDDGAVHLGQLGQALGAELGVEQEAARADRQHVGAVPDHHQAAPLGPQDPVEPVAQRSARGHHGQGIAHGRVLACGHPRNRTRQRVRRHRGRRVTAPAPSRQPKRPTASATVSARISSTPGGPAGAEAGTTTRPNPSRAASSSRRGQVRDLAHLARQPDLAHRGQVGGQGDAGDGRGHRQGDGQVGGRLGHPDPAGHRGEDVDGVHRAGRHGGPARPGS